MLKSHLLKQFIIAGFKIQFCWTSINPLRCAHIIKRHCGPPPSKSQSTAALGLVLQSRRARIPSLTAERLEACTDMRGSQRDNPSRAATVRVGWLSASLCGGRDPPPHPSLPPPLPPKLAAAAGEPQPAVTLRLSVLACLPACLPCPSEGPALWSNNSLSDSACQFP